MGPLDSMTLPLFTAAVLALLAGTVLPLLALGEHRRYFHTLSLGCTVIAAAVLGILSAIILVTGDFLHFTLFTLGNGASFSCAIDKLSAFFLLIISAVSVPVAIYFSGYIGSMEGTSRRSLVCSFTNLFILAMVLVVSSGDTFMFFFCWELMAASSFFLVVYDYTRESTRNAGIIYFFMTQLSSLFVLLGIVILFCATGSFAMAPLPGAPALLVTAAFLCLFTGFSIKAGVIPFHKWLPYAHPASPSPVSALMSGVMVKIAVYGLLRFLVTVFTPELWWGFLIFAAGLGSAVLGIIYALKEHDIKGMLAYSSIENIGIIFTGVGLFVIFTATGLPLLATIALLGALFHSLNHALAKSLLFLTSGSVVHATHTREIEQMGGLINRMPYTSAFFFIGAASLAALPPLNGFASEVLILTAFFTSIPVVDPLLKILLFFGLALFALASTLSAVCFVKAFGSVFLALPRSQASEKASEVPATMLAGPAILAAACVITGVFAYQILIFAGYVLPIPDMFLISLLLLGVMALVYILIHYTASRSTRTGETWGCGLDAPRPSAEYTGHGLSEPVEIIFSPIYRTRIVQTRQFFDQKHCIYREGTGEIRLMKVFEEYLYLPVARAGLKLAGFISRFQNNCLDTYLLYVFLAVIALILFLGWSP